MKRILALLVVLALAASLAAPVAAQNATNETEGATATERTCEPVDRDGTVRVCNVEETDGSVTVTLEADQPSAVTVSDGLAWQREDSYRPPTVVVREEPVNVSTSLTYSRGLAGVVVTHDGYQWGEIIRQETTLPGSPGQLDAPAAAGGVGLAVLIVAGVCYLFYKYRQGGVIHEF